MAKKKDSSIASIRELWSLLDRTAFAISRLREIELSQFGITIPQSSILHVLHVQGGALTLQDLGKNRMRQHHSISTLINRMAKIGLVLRTKTTNGKRYQIKISPAGQKIRTKLTETSLRMVFSSLSAKEKRDLADDLIPLLEKARYLLGMSQTTPFLSHLSQKKANPEINRKISRARIVTDYDLWILFDRVGFAISRLREIELAQFGLTLPQSAILDALQTHHGSMAIPELKEYTMRQPHSIFMLLKRMVKMGLIEQPKDPRKKKNLIVITRKGEELDRQVTPASLDLTFSTLSSQAQKHLAGLLALILEKARYLLGVTYVPPILKYLSSEDPGKTKR
jgi:DNA-binding MarR family transcriptional regulator